MTTTDIEILLVEDNPRDVEMTLRALKKHNMANKVHVVTDGAEAMDFIFTRGAYAHTDKNQVPKVVFLDLKLPKVGGLEVLRAIKGDERTRSIPGTVFSPTRRSSSRRPSRAS